MNKEPKELIVINKMYNDFNDKRLYNGEISRYPLYYRCYIEGMKVLLKRIQKYKSSLDYYTNENDGYSESQVRVSENVIAFLGRRGSGKTTAVTDFCGILKNFDDKYWYKSCGFSEQLNGSNIKFVVLPPIDASLLDEKEDIMELIWAQMVQLVEKKKVKINLRNDKDEKYKKVIRLFDEIYKDYSRLCQQNSDEGMGFSVMALLRNMSSSNKVRDGFSDLLSNFFDFLKEVYDQEQYLVITIDDLDLNLEQGYGMLEQIYKYLSHPKVVVLLTADIEQLGVVCENYIAKKLYRKDASSGEKKRIERLSGQLAKDYLSKVMPIMNRVYLPGNEQISQETEVILNTDTFKGEELKKYLFRKIFNKTGILYDGLGLKTHFCIPKTIRELVAYNDFLDELYNIDKNYLELQYNYRSDLNKEDLPEEIISVESHFEMQKKYNNNLRRFISDIYERMSYQILDFKQINEFMIIKNRNIERRAKYVVGYSTYRMNEKKFVDDVDDSQYVYGNLIEGIYRWGRKIYSDKPFIHVIIASLTAEMTKHYFTICDNIDKSAEAEYRRVKSRSVLQQFIGRGFGNNWLGEMIPQVSDIIVPKSNEDKISNQYGFAYREKVHTMQMKWTYDFSIKNFKNVDVINQDFLKFVEENKIVQELECLYMFFNNVESGEYSELTQKFVLRDDSTFGKDADQEYKGDKETEKVTDESINKSKDGTSDIIRFWVDFNINNMDYDVLGFLGKILYNDSRYTQIDNDIVELLLEFYRKIIGKLKLDFKEKEKGKIKKLVDENSIWKTEDAIANEQNVFPFYALDLSYNVLKRVRRTCKEKIGVITSKEYFDSVKIIYGQIAHELKREDDFYKGIGITTTFENNFKKSPFIKTIGLKYINQFDDSIGGGDDVIKGDLPSSFGDRFSEFVKTLISFDDVGDNDSVE